MIILSIMNFFKSSLGYKFLKFIPYLILITGAVLYAQNIKASLDALKVAQVTIAQQATVINQLQKEMELMKQSHQVTVEALTKLNENKKELTKKINQTKPVVKEKIKVIESGTQPEEVKTNLKSEVYIDDLQSVYLTVCNNSCGVS